METHSTVKNPDGSDIPISRWDHSIWNDLATCPKLKADSATVNANSELANKTMCCVTADNIVHDKMKTIRECYKCEQCQEIVTSKQMLRQHKDSVHNDRKTFRCTVANCVRAFTSANYLKNHVDIEHTDCSEASIPCPKKDCGLFFPNNYRLKRHIRQDHKQEKLYQCQVCSRKFASLEVRNNHTKTKHGSTPLRDSFPSNLLDNNVYRSEQNKESENDTVYAASPISSKFESLHELSSIDTTCEAQWLTKASDSNPLLSKQIDRILCDIFSDKYQERLHSPLSSSELAIAIVSLEETNDEDKRKPAKISSHLNSLISERSSPFKSAYLFNELDKKLYTSHNRLTSNHTNTHNGFSYNHNNNISMAGQNYPQSNTESEGHSTESQRSFLVSSSQHEEFSDISMEGHLKDVFATAVDKWNVHGNTVNSYDNPIKLMDYTCLDTMFDDFHEIITSDSFNTLHLPNGSSSLAADFYSIPGSKNHLLSLNNMHSKFLGGSQFGNIDHLNRVNPVPSNQITTFSNYELNRRKINNSFHNSNIRHSPYEISPPNNTEPHTRDSSYGLDISRRCHRNPMINGPPFRQEGRMRENYSQGYPYRSNQLMGNNQMYYNRDAPSMYIQQSEKSQYPLCFNGSTNPNPLYPNPIEMEYVNESQSHQYTNVFRRRGPPQAYQVGGFSHHQMLPSQHSAVAAATAAATAAASLAYAPPPLPMHPNNNNSCFHPQTTTMTITTTTTTTTTTTNCSSRSCLYADSPVSSSSSSLPRQRQQQHPRHLFYRHRPMALDPQGRPSNKNHPTAISIDINSGLEFKDDTILCEEQILSESSNEQSINRTDLR